MIRVKVKVNQLHNFRLLQSGTTQLKGNKSKWDKNHYWIISREEASILSIAASSLLLGSPDNGPGSEMPELNTSQFNTEK